jgi:hypothetical protein
MRGAIPPLAQHAFMAWWLFKHRDNFTFTIIHNLYGTHGGGERCLQGFVWEERSKRPLGRPRRRWEDNFKMDFREIGIDANIELDSAGSGQCPVSGVCEHGNEPSGSMKKAGYFFSDKPSDNRLFKYPSPWSELISK